MFREPLRFPSFFCDLFTNFVFFSLFSESGAPNSEISIKSCMKRKKKESHEEGFKRKDLKYFHSMQPIAMGGWEVCLPL